ncbi:MAG: DMT family transporter [Hyphomicrobiaceae bacterium]|nr:DMT family transporter [Hyphomicrobiaceae bacterium]
MTDAAMTRVQPQVLRALAWMGLALASFTSVAIAGREAARGATTLEMMFYRCLMSLAVVLVIVLLGPGLKQMRTTRLKLHMLRGGVHFIAQFSWLSALTIIPLAQLFAIEFTAPIWVALLAPLLLGERLTQTRLAAAALGFAGAVIVVQPGTVALGPGVALAFVSAIGFALSMLATKTLTQGESPLRILFYMFLAQTALSLLLLVGGVRLPDWETMGWIGALALTGLAAHYSLVRAFALADAIIVAPMDFFRLPLIAVVGVVIYAEPFDPIVLLGGLVVIAGNVLNMRGERRNRAGV